jgi:hypothetical protein
MSRKTSEGKVKSVSFKAETTDRHGSVKRNLKGLFVVFGNFL